MNDRTHGHRRRFSLRPLPLDLQPTALVPMPAGDQPVCDLDILLHVRRAAKKEALPIGPATGLVG